MKKIRLTLLFLFCYATLFAQQNFEPIYSTAGFYEVENSPREVYNFNQGWRFFKGDVKDGEKITFDDSLWEAATLPHGLEILPQQASGGINYQGVAWYRKKFDIKPCGGRVYLHFEAIMGKSKIWVNGNLVGENYGGYLPISLDITNNLTDSGKGNIVAVMADNSDDNTYLPGQPQNRLDFSYFGGIYRDSYIIKTKNIHISLTELSKNVAGGSIFVATCAIDNKKREAQMEVRSEVVNHTNKRAKITIKQIVEDYDHNELQSFSNSFIVAANDSKQFNRKFTMSNVALWYPDTPNLHFLRTEVYHSGVLVDEFRTRFGVRLFELRQKEGLFINNEPAKSKLFGVNRHQDYGTIGNALPNSGQWRDVKILREGGAKVIRAAHYPQDPAFYDACDYYGMVTSTATPGWHFYNDKDTIFKARMIDDSRRLVRRDRNCASILFWEIALNETPWQDADAVKKSHEVTHLEYPFPGVYTAANIAIGTKAGVDMCFQSTNKNDNNYFIRETGDGGEVDDWVSNNAETRVLREWGEAALVNQALVQTKYLRGYNAPTEKLIGVAKWAGIDHQRGSHPDPFWGGLLDAYRTPKYLYFLHKSQYDADFKLKGIESGPMVYIAHELNQISPKDVVIFSNCDQVRLTWLGKVVATLEPDNETYPDMAHAPFIFKDVYHFSDLKTQWRPDMPSTEMIAEGIIDGKVVTTTRKEYVRIKDKIELSVESQGIELSADQSDIMLIRATIKDVNNQNKVLASQYIHFEIEGEGELGASSETYTNPVKTEFGTANILVRSTGKAGNITVTAHSATLESASITFSSKPSKMKEIYNKEYASKSKKAENKFSIQVKGRENNLPTDVVELQDKLEKLELKMVGQQQEIMELRNQLGK